MAHTAAAEACDCLIVSTLVGVHLASTRNWSTFVHHTIFVTLLPGPVSLLSGLNPRPSVLVAHFFMVAVYGVGRLLLPRPTCRGLWTGLLLLWGAAGAWCDATIAAVPPQHRC